MLTWLIAVLRFLHLRDNAGMLPRGDQNYDPMFKLRPLLTHMKHKFGEYFVPSKHIAIDEAMIAYDGRVYFKQCMPQKPTKWGIKVWEVTDSATGYCLDFDVFGGKERRRSAYGVGYDVIHKLSQRYLNKHYHLHFDRYFTGLPIIEYLYRNGTYASGTVRLDRKGLPKAAKTVKLERGASVFYQKNNTNIVLTTWRDKRQVNLLSSCASDRVDAQGKPDAIVKFNKYMGGVDLSNQLCTYYRVGRPSHKWWRYVFWFVVNVAITNAWLLFKASVSAERLAQTSSHKKFVLELTEELENEFSSRRKAVRRPVRRRIPVRPLALDRDHGHELIKFDGRALKCWECALQGRRTLRGYKKETTTKCKQCDVALCRGPCFLNFHTPANAVNDAEMSE